MKRTLFLSLSSEEWSLSSSEERLASCSSFSSSIYTFQIKRAYFLIN
jgi:hypothetical protein